MFNDSRLTVSWKDFLRYRRSFGQRPYGSSGVADIGCANSCSAVMELGGGGTGQIQYRSKGLWHVSILPLMIRRLFWVWYSWHFFLGLPFGMVTLLITVFCVPYILMEVKARLVGMDPSLEEAAMDLGATPTRIFFDITLPLIMPAVLSGALLAFAMSMDDVVISVFVNGPRLSTLPIKVYTQMKTGVTPEINALCTLMLAVSVIVLLAYSLARRLSGRNGVKTNKK
ncbi:MAG: ABC transporter permease [Blautia sp.]